MTTATAPEAPAETGVVVHADAPTLTPFEVIERVITSGDLGQMKPQERVAFYWRTCESLGLNPLTRPFEFIQLNGKLTMYARKDATDQLRKINRVSVTRIRREKDDELGLVTVYATGTDGTGRTDEAEGVVSIKGLSGEALANALMKAATKAKRRLTLSLVGLGFLDESELEGATVDVDPTTGVVIEREKPKTLLEAVKAQQEAMATPAPEAAQDDDSASWIDGDATEAPAEPEAAPRGPASFDELRDLIRARGARGAAIRTALASVLADKAPTLEELPDAQLTPDEWRAIAASLEEVLSSRS
jgi:hypothetical protein